MLSASDTWQQILTQSRQKVEASANHKQQQKARQHPRVVSYREYQLYAVSSLLMGCRGQHLHSHRPMPLAAMWCMPARDQRQIQQRRTPGVAIGKSRKERKRKRRIGRNTWGRLMRCMIMLRAAHGQSCGWLARTH